MRVTTTLLLFLSSLQTIHCVPTPEPENQPEQKPLSAKYFQEPDEGVLAHYDSRFFKDKVEGEEHAKALRNLIRSYVITLRTIGVDTWLAHGTLLGWWWNGKLLPWDNDADVQMAESSLEVLARGYNCTTHVYHYQDPDGGLVTGNYLLDINPHHSEMRGDGMNIIDARWIDMSNGMYVDITGLAEREKGNGTWSCRNHDYEKKDFFPLKEMVFEGVPALVPFSFEKVLVSEYGEKSMTTTEWEGHIWSPEQKEWIKKPEEKKEDEQKENEKKD